MRASTLQEADEDDLLQPVLDSSFDVRGFGALCDPTRLFWPCFLGGPIAGGLLLGLNYLNRNVRRMAFSVWAGSVLLEILAQGITAWLVTRAATQDEGNGMRSLMHFATAVSSVLLGWHLGRRQRPQFQAFINARGRPLALFWPGFGAIVLGLASGVWLGMLWSWLLALEI